MEIKMMMMMMMKPEGISGIRFNELAMKSKNKNIRDWSRGINDFKRGNQT
jgi:hypothetical protein